MQGHPVHQSWISFAVTIAVIVVIMGLRLRRMGRMRPLKLGSLWIVPAMYLVVAAIMFTAFPPTGPIILGSLAALAIGAVLGWQRGKMMHIEVDQDTRSLNQRASPASMIFLLVLICVRMALRQVVGQGSGVTPAMITDPLIAFALGILTLQRVEMYLRAKRLLDEAHGGT